MGRWTITVLGEGALVGFLAGLGLGAVRASAHGDLQQGSHHLLAIRVQSLVEPALLTGMVASVLLLLVGAWLTGRLPGRSPQIGIAAVGAGAATLLLLSDASRTLLSEVIRLPGASEGTARLGLAILLGAALVLLMLRVAGVHSLVGRSATGPPRWRTVAAGLGLAGAVLAAVAHVALPELSIRRAAGHPSVVLISIDTLRADRLGAAGYPRSLTPNLDRLCEEGALFLDAQATSSWTFPSHLSLLTATLPFDQGGRIWRARPEFVMLAELFREQGYRTAAYTGGTWVDDSIGFGQGFESFESYDEIALGGPEGYFQEAAAWVEQLDGAPFFLFLHTYEPHIPYTHDDFAGATGADAVGEVFDIDDLQAIRSGELVLDEHERQHVIDLYDGDVAAADRYVGAFLEQLDALRPPEDTIVVVVSDHGEDLWDHVPERSADHGHSLYDELLAVPLIVRKSGDVPGGTQIGSPVSLVDVVPTVLELAGLPSGPQLAGRSLAFNLRSGLEPTPRLVFAEMVEYGPDRFSVRRGRLKVIATPYPDVVHNDVHLVVDTLEVFDLELDPDELVPTVQKTEAGGWIHMAEILRQRAADVLGMEPQPGREPEVPEELQEQLRALGYMN